MDTASSTIWSCPTAVDVSSVPGLAEREDGGVDDPTHVQAVEVLQEVVKRHPGKEVLDKEEEGSE